MGRVEPNFYKRCHSIQYIEMLLQGRHTIFSSEGALKIWHGHSSLCWCFLEVDKKGQDMPKLCDGDNGKRNTSAIGIGHMALYVVRLETYAFNIT